MSDRIAPETLRIFISSPGDVAEERALTRRVVERLSGEFAERVSLEPIYWEHEPLRATGSWHSQVFPPSEADIVVCILWARLGTRQPAEITRPDGSRYESGTEYEFEEAWRAYQERGQPDLLVYRKTKEPRVSLRDKAELMDRMGQKEALDRFMDTWFQDREEGTLIAAFHPFDSAHDFEELVEIHLRKLIEERLPSTGAVPARRVKVWTEGSPFRGLEAFEFAHAGVFSGRTRATSEVVDSLRVQAAAGRPFVLVLGMSGCGKSSLVRAGVLPLLTQPGVIEGVGLWRRAIVRPSDGGGDPFVGLAAALLDAEALPELGEDGTGGEELARLLRESPEAAFALIKGGLSQAAAEVARTEELAAQPEARLALVVDQMEELFTTEAIGEADGKRFTEALRALAGSGKVWVLGTLRSDFYPRLAELPALVELKEGGGQYDLLPPDPAEIGQMIRRPAQLAALGFEERETTGERLDDALRDAAARNPEALPLLQFTLEELYKARTGDGVLGFAAYEELGGVEGALAQRAEAVLEGLSPEARAALPLALSRLVRVDADGADGATRQRARLEAFAEGSPERAAVERFVEARLCVTDRDESGTAVVSLAHEALLEHWPRLRQWLGHNRELFRMRERLDAAAAQWEAEGRPSASLLASGKRLAEAEELEAAEGIELPAREHAFLQASIAKGRSTRWLKRAAVVALGVLTVLAAAGAFYANQKRGEAEVARGESEAVTDFLSDMLASVDPEELGRDVLVQDVLDQASEKLGDLEDQPLIQARLANTMGGVYQSLGLYDKARPLVERSVTIREEHLGPDHPLLARSLADRGWLLRSLGEYEEAQTAFERAKTILEADPDAHAEQLTALLSNYGNLFLTTGDYERARGLFEEKLEAAERLYGPKHPEVAVGLNSLAELLRTLGEGEAALPLYERAATIWEKELGPDHIKLAATLNNIGLLFDERGDSARARTLFERTLTIEEKALGPDHPDVADTLENLASILAEQGEREPARLALQRALDIKESALGPDHNKVAGALNNLGSHLLHYGDYSEAKPLFERSLSILEETLGADHFHTAMARHNLGGTLLSLGAHAAARPLLEQAVATAEAALGRQHVAPVMLRTTLAELLSQTGEFELAASLWSQSLADLEQTLGNEHAYFGMALTGASRLRHQMGQATEAEAGFRQARACLEAALGEEDEYVAGALFGLAEVLSDVGELSEAETLFERALAIQEARLGHEHPEMADTLEGYSKLLRRTGRQAEAAAVEQRMRAIRPKDR